MPDGVRDGLLPGTGSLAFEQCNRKVISAAALSAIPGDPLSGASNEWPIAMSNAASRLGEAAIRPTRAAGLECNGVAD